MSRLQVSPRDIGHANQAVGLESDGRAARWYLQEPGREWRGGLEQRLRVVAAEQLDLPIPESNRRERGSEPEAEGSEAAAVLLPGGNGKDVEDGVVGEEGGVGGDAIVEG